MRTTVIFIVSFWILAATAWAGDFKDFSASSPEHKILRDLRLDALNVDFVEKRRIHSHGKDLEASVFFVRTSQTVPFLSGINPYNNVMKDIYGFYDLVVAEAADSQIHDFLIESIHASLSRQPTLKDFGLVRGPSSYLIFAGSTKSPDLVWIGGKLVHAKFRRFTEKRSDIKNDVESFWKEKIRFNLEGTRIQIESPKKGFREEFLQMHREGAFSRKKAN